MSALLFDEAFAVPRYPVRKPKTPHLYVFRIKVSRPKARSKGTIKSIWHPDGGEPWAVVSTTHVGPKVAVACDYRPEDQRPLRPRSPSMAYHIQRGSLHTVDGVWVAAFILETVQTAYFVACRPPAFNRAVPAQVATSERSDDVRMVVEFERQPNVEIWDWMQERWPETFVV